MVSVSPVHLPLSPQELHVHEDYIYIYDYLIHRYGSQQVYVILET